MIDKIQTKRIEARLQALADILKKIGPKFHFQCADTDGGIWEFRIRRLERYER